jgi:DNA uptake protein ComE-like DNA-binding protein
MAADAPPHKAGAAKAGHADKAVAHKAPAKKAKSMQKAPEWVDINSASREQLKKLPGIGDVEADRIVKGRPFLSKAQLQTDGIVSPMAYQGLRNLVVAEQKNAKFAKAAK